jgi:phospholipase D-like protein
VIWGFVGGVFGLILLAIWVVTIIDIVGHHLGAAKTSAWILIIIIVPFLGSLLYWILRKPTPEEIQRHVDGQLALRDATRARDFDSTTFTP